MAKIFFLTLLQHFQTSQKQSPFCAQIVVFHYLSGIINLPQIHVNSIGEKLIIERDWTWSRLEIRRLPMNCSDSGYDIWKKIWETRQDLQRISLW